MTRRVVPVMVVGLMSGALAAACGGGSQESAAPPPPLENPVDPATAGAVTGRVTFTGAAPTMPALRMESDPNCVQQGGGTASDDSVIVGGDGALQNVFVYVKEGLGDLRFPVPSTAVVLDQKGCRYAPHVLGAQVGQAVEIVNSDPTLHNIHAVPMSNQEFNTGQPLPGMKHAHRFSAREVMVPFKCDVHPWMHAYIGILDHPFFAVTTADGSFQLNGVPPGTYTIEAWHEKLGTLTQMVTIGAKETGNVTFSFKSTT